MAHIVVFAGEYDLANKTELREEFRRLDSAKELVLDMSEVTFVDSSFISELFLLEKRRREAGRSGVTVVTQRNCVRKLFEITGILRLINVVESYPNGSAESVIEYANVGRLT